MYFDIIKDSLKSNRKERALKKYLVDELCRYTEMNEGQLLHVSVLLNTRFQADVIKKGIEIYKLEQKVEGLTADNDLLKEKRDATNYELRINRMQNGEKTAYKAEVTKERIMEYKKQGMTNKAIAIKLKVSLGTIWRRIREIDK
jgi:hypothetical protein